MLIDKLLKSLGDRDEALVQSESSGRLWREAIEEMIRAGRPELKDSERFHTEWITRGHRIRELVNDDNLLLDAIRQWLPMYTGPSLTLYRGENIERWRSNRCGFAWTDKREIAVMFARGLNAMYGEGGILLSTVAPATAIIAGPNSHSIWLNEDEYVLDIRHLGEITELQRFPKV